jgi:hypothetical protein
VTTNRFPKSCHFLSAARHDRCRGPKARARQMRLLAYLSIVAVTTPALCTQYFIVQEPRTDRCTIVEQAPGSGGVVVFGDGAQGERPPEGSGPVVVGDGAYGDRPTAEGDTSNPSGDDRGSPATTPRN